MGRRSQPVARGDASMSFDSTAIFRCDVHNGSADVIDQWRDFVRQSRCLVWKHRFPHYVPAHNRRHRIFQIFHNWYTIGFENLHRVGQPFLCCCGSFAKNATRSFFNIELGGKRHRMLEALHGWLLARHALVARRQPGKLPTVLCWSKLLWCTFYCRHIKDDKQSTSSET